MSMNLSGPWIIDPDQNGRIRPLNLGETPPEGVELFRTHADAVKESQRRNREHLRKGIRRGKGFLDENFPGWLDQTDKEN